MIKFIGLQNVTGDEPYTRLASVSVLGNTGFLMILFSFISSNKYVRKYFLNSLIDAQLKYTYRIDPTDACTYPHINLENEDR